MKIPDGLPETVNRSDNTREKTRKKEKKSNNGPQKTWDELRPLEFHILRAKHLIQLITLSPKQVVYHYEVSV